MATSRAANTQKDSAQGLLASLIFSSALPQPKSAKVQRTPREVMLAAIEEQIKLCEADIQGEPLTIKKSRFIKNPDGSSVKTEVDVLPRRCYWLNADGNYLVSLRYGGSIPVELSPGNPSIVAGKSHEEVLPVLKTIKSAIEAGEADASIEVAAARMKRKKAA